MTIEELLPPRRELPEDLRYRLREDVLTRLDRPKRGRWGVVAAAVVLLAGAATAGVQLWRDESPPVAGPSADPAALVLDRCWAAAETAGKAGQLPPRGSWTSPVSAGEGEHVGVAFLAAGKPAVCETTATSVTLTNPDAPLAYAEGSRTALLLHTTGGLAAGIADPAWARLELSREDGLGITMERITSPEHLFLSFTKTPPSMGALWAGRWDTDQIERTWPRAALPAPPPPLFSVIDRAGDRSSPAGAALKECFARASHPPDDADSYQAGTLLENGRFRVVVARNAAHALVCSTDGETAQVHVDTFVGKSIPVRRLIVPDVGGRVAFVGIVPPSATRMIADFGTGKPVDVPVANGTFAIWPPEGSIPVETSGTTWVKASTAQGTPLFNGEIGGK
ncbi:hypothetical protein [Amycolatopsis pittospori]|uniref:hypothetical protein n=1 Tax=Amycolatopsis pittospori TaxID=2749434 RepID=UPI001A9F806C|nr:hypothetical protein [Amycolatopsis pittospori]